MQDHPSAKECREQLIPELEEYGRFVQKKVTCSYSALLKNTYFQIYQLNFISIQALWELVKSHETDDPQKSKEYYQNYLKLDKETKQLEVLKINAHMLETESGRKRKRRAE